MQAANDAGVITFNYGNFLNKVIIFFLVCICLFGFVKVHFKSLSVAN